LFLPTYFLEKDSLLVETSFVMIKNVTN